MRRLSWIVLTSGIVLASLAGLGSSPASAASPWSVQATPNPVIPTGEMFGVSCTASTACTAVGYSSNSSGTDLTLAERWNGTSWSIQTTPNPAGAIYGFLTGVSCTTATACTAVGYYGNSSGTELPLAEHWNGSTWSIQATPAPTGATFSAFLGVACTSASACIAVGNDGSRKTSEGTLAEAWNGTTWSVQTTATPSGASVSSLSGISCTSNVSCMAVGSYYNSATELTLAESWNGSAWSVSSTTNPSGATLPNLTGVSCTQSSACTAVGSYYNSGGTQVSLAERWNGTSWSIQSTPNPSGAKTSGLSSVSCSSATSCTAVGVYTNSSGTLQQTLSEYWTGTTWYLQGTPNATNQVTSALLFVSCLAGQNAFCFGVGFSSSGTTFTPLTIAYYGPLYPLLTAVPSPNGAATSVLSAVSCVTATACTGVGYSTTSSGVSTLLVEAWNGVAWSIESAPVPAGAGSSSFSGVSCRAATSCEAVGSYVNNAGTRVTLAEAWNGTVWSVQSTPNPSGATNSAFSSVTCTSVSACEAVGYSVTTSEYPLAEVWNGTSWAVQVSRVPSGAIGGAFTGVSCAGGGCDSVGSYVNSAGAIFTLVEGLYGPYGWIGGAGPSPTGATSSTLSGISCTSNAACMASGSFTNSTGTHTLAASLSPTGWSLQSPSSPGASLSALTGVSCTSATACTAVGYYINTSGITVTLAEAWAGSSWAVQATPNPAIASASLLYGVSCTAATTCTAVGRYNNGVPLTLAEAN